MATELETQTNGEGRTRKRLTPLLKKLLNDATIPELCWRDTGRQIWQMPWKYHKQTRWGDPDALMLRELAKGMYNYQGEDEPAKEKLKQWKELLRNALRSLKDVKELNDLHVTDGDRPYKVYQFVENESEGVKRGRGVNACQARNSKGRCEQMQKVAADCSISSENYSNAIDFLNLCQHSSNRQPPPVAIPTNIPFLDSLLQSKPSQLLSGDLTNKQIHNGLLQHNHHPSALPMQSSSVNNDAEIFPGNLADNVDDSILNNLMSEFNLGSFRSRSPLSHNNETENGMDIHEVSVTDVENLNSGTLSTTGVCEHATTALVNDLLESVSYNRCQPVIGFNEFGVDTFQNKAGNNDGNNAVNTGFHFTSTDIFYRLQNIEGNPKCEASPMSCIKNIAVQHETPVLPHTVLSDINSHHNVNPYLGDKPLLSSQLDQKNYPSLNRILSDAPAASLVVVVYYNMCQVAKCQILSRKFRICFVPDDQTRESITTCLDPRQFGPIDVDLFELPEIRKDAGMSLQARDTKNILSNLTRGVIIDLRDADIYATRYCKAVPHFCISGKTEFTKMERHQEVKIFDFRDYFEHSFNPRYRYQNAEPYVRLSFAVRDANKKASALTVDIWHTDAFQAKLQTAENIHSLEAECSLSDEYDRRVEIEQLLKNTVLHLYTTKQPM